MKVHASYELLTDDGKPVPQGTRLVDIQNEDGAITFAGMAIDEHGQPQIQLIDHDARGGSGVGRLHAENAGQLRLATAPTSEPAADDVTRVYHAPPVDDVSGKLSNKFRDMRELVLGLSKRYEICRSALPGEVSNFIEHALHYGDVATLRAAKAAIDSLVPDPDADIPF